MAPLRSVIQQKNKKNLRIDASARSLTAPGNPTNSAGTASSPLLFGSTPEVNKDTPPIQPPLRLRNGPQRKHPVRAPPNTPNSAVARMKGRPEFDVNGSDTREFTKVIPRRTKRNLKKSENTLLILPTKDGDKAYFLLQSIPSIQQQWIVYHLQYETGPVLLHCSSKENKEKINDLISESSELRVKEKLEKPYEFRIHNIKLSQNIQEMSKDIAERFGLKPLGINILPYIKVADKGFAVVKASQELFERVKKANLFVLILPQNALTAVSTFQDAQHVIYLGTRENTVRVKEKKFLPTKAASV